MFFGFVGDCAVSSCTGAAVIVSMKMEAIRTQAMILATVNEKINLISFSVSVVKCLIRKVSQNFLLSMTSVNY